MCIHLHFPKLNNICHFSDHLTNFSRSSCKLCLFVALVTFLNTFVSSANLSTLLRGDQIEVFKIVNGYEDVDRNMFFKFKEGSRTRGHKAALVKEQN